MQLSHENSILKSIFVKIIPLHTFSFTFFLSKKKKFFIKLIFSLNFDIAQLIGKEIKVTNAYQNTIAPN